MLREQAEQAAAQTQELLAQQAEQAAPEPPVGAAGLESPEAGGEIPLIMKNWEEKQLQLRKEGMNEKEIQNLIQKY